MTDPSTFKEGDFVTHPCMRKGCESIIEDEWTKPEDWYCTYCWPAIEKARNKAHVETLEARIKELEERVAFAEQARDNVIKLADETKKSAKERGRIAGEIIGQLKALTEGIIRAHLVSPSVREHYRTRMKNILSKRGD